MNLLPKTIRATSVGSPILCPLSMEASEQSTKDFISSFSSLSASKFPLSDGTSFILPGVYIFTTVILFCVSVPVLSEQIIFTAPNVSTAGSFLTMAFILDILVTPIERTMATIATSPSGIAATARLIAVISISIQFLP